MEFYYSVDRSKETGDPIVTILGQFKRPNEAIKAASIDSIVYDGCELYALIESARLAMAFVAGEPR